jgi:hypothetical protein
MGRTVGTEAKDAIMTAGQRLIEQGVQQGIQQGASALRQRFGNEVGPSTEQRITTASTEQIHTWADRLMTAPTLGELLAD